MTIEITIPNALHNALIHLATLSPLGMTEDAVAVFLRGELKRRNLSYAVLAERLTAIGVKESERNVSNKIARGSFTTTFFLQCMEAIGVSTIHLGDK